MIAPRLCIVANDIALPEVLNSGGHRHYLRCVPYWQGRFDITIVAPKYAHRDLARAVPGVRLVPTPLGTVFKGDRASALAIRCLTAFLIPAADVYYSGSPVLPNVIGPAIRRIFRPKRRFVVVIHHLVDREARRRATTRASLPILAENVGVGVLRLAATHVLPGSAAVFTELRRLRFDPNNFSMTQNAPSNESIRPVPPDAPRAAEVVYLGNVSKRKGALDIIKAWRTISARHPEARLRMIGQIDPNDRRAVEDALRGAGPLVSVESGLADPEVADRLARARIFAAPSYEEGWGIALAEAMSAGLAAVTYDLAAYDPVFGRSTRAIVPTGDARALAEEISALLSDDKRRIALATRGMERARAFTWKAVAEGEARHFKAPDPGR